MIINNPKSLAGFNRNDQNHEADYQLATVGQLTTAIRNLDNKIKTLLNGTITDDEGNPIDYINRTIGENMGGLSHGKGYAWINKYTGKIDESLLPSLAITETYVVGLGKVLPEMYDGDNVTGTFYTALDRWCKKYQKASTDENGIVRTNFQKGDIIIVTFDNPGNDDYTVGQMYDEVPSASYTTEGLTNIDAGHPTSPKLGENTQYLGTYIITKCPPDRSDDPFIFAKMAYTDSNIVSINSIAPHNSAGQMTLYLKDILAVKRNIDRAPGASNDFDDPAINLERIVFSLSTGGAGTNPEIKPINVGSNKYERFSFKSMPVNTNTVSAEFGYATINELDDETAERKFDDAYLSGVINIANANIGFLSGVLGDCTSGHAVTDTMTVGMFAERSAATATVFDQLEALRFSIDHNADMLDIARDSTAKYLDELYQNIGYLYSSLNGKAVAFIEKKFTWSAGDAHRDTQSDLHIQPTDYLYNSEDPDLYQPGNGEYMLKGIVNWEYDYHPGQTGETTDEAYGNHFDFPNVQSVKDSSGAEQHKIYSDERVVAVFDNNGNRIDVDLKRITPSNNNFAVPYTRISVTTDYIIDGDGNMVNSLVGTTWTLLIAKTIIDIPLDFTVGNTVEIGSNTTFSSKRDSRINEAPTTLTRKYEEVPIQPRKEIEP